jgi:hypothetical protein
MLLEIRRCAAILLTMRKLILILFMIIALAAGLFAVFAISSEKIETITGVFLAIASLSAALWCLSLLKQTYLTIGTGILLSVIVLLISFTTVAYASVEPFAGIKDDMLVKIGLKDKSLVETIGDSLPSPPLSGTFISEKGGKQFITFKDDTIEMYGESGEKQIFLYEISDNRDTIQCTDIFNGNTTTLQFNYLTNYGIVVIDNIEYYRD